ncbi:hypothetical protein CL618_01345 [archaeon]|nr:hypothetical protein [archaeon]|tara:strand:+ start:4198 stop:5679 length:1482 start_codon:yes stop_codon:yes gene_type:complete
MKNLINSLSPLERKIIPFLKNDSTLQDLKESHLSEIEITRALQWLENKHILKIHKQKQELIQLDINGLKYKEKGLPEKQLLNLLKTPLTIQEIKEKSNLSNEEVNISLGLLKKQSLIQIRDKVSLTKKELTKSLEEQFLKSLPLQLSKLKPEQKHAYQELKKRKQIIKTITKKELNITLTSSGKELIKQRIPKNLTETLTPELIKNHKNLKFRRYDVQINVPSITGGRRHPYNESMNIIRNVFLEMGFQEMEGPWVETAFWGMDSMWIAQDHPMRDAQDTFYLDKKGKLPDKKFIKKVKSAHEDGYNTGSTGHTKEWDPEVAKELILRQHSTSTTFRYFYDLKLNQDCKYFYIADNFRNEAIDATHLPEFGQAEGFIMGDNLTLADLMGFIKEFYKKLGITKIKFKPTFNPYTEPSMEAHYYNEKLGKWYALINSGIFRPEALAPYGITKSVIAWGMGSSRIAAILTGKKKLKDLFGPEVDINWIKTHKRIKL